MISNQSRFCTPELATKHLIGLVSRGHIKSCTTGLLYRDTLHITKKRHTSVQQEMKKLTFQRDQLYKEVWSTPMTHLADKYGITYDQLKKVCRELEIPLPDRGYWPKVQNGKEVKGIDLPGSDKDMITLNITDTIISEGKKKKPER